ncbi:MAG TPA: hypothetical protein VF840_02800 [Terriglobales bacterium]
MAVAAYASPIFGTWKGELNGRPITITVTYTNRHTDVRMMDASRELTVSNAKFANAPPTLLQFQAANQEGKAKLVSSGGSNLSFELETADGQVAALRVIDQGKTIETVKMTKAPSAK